MYQYSVGRTGCDKVSDLFRKMEEEEIQRSLNMKSAILFKNGTFENISPPFMLDKTTDENYKEINLLYRVVI